jgi:hypothetical protein
MWGTLDPKVPRTYSSTRSLFIVFLSNTVVGKTHRYAQENYQVVRDTNATQCKSINTAVLRLFNKTTVHFAKGTDTKNARSLHFYCENS